MRMILKNVDLSFLSKKKKYFKDIISGVNEFGGGYYPVPAGPETTKNGNIIQTTLNTLPLKYKLEQGHTYLFGFKSSAHYCYARTSNIGETNGIVMQAAVGDLEGHVSVVKDKESSNVDGFGKYPYITLHQPSNNTKNVTYELYLYDITGEDVSKFNSFTFSQLKSGTISVYEE